MTDRTQLHHLADRARRGVLLPAEGALLADAITALLTDLDRYEEVVVGELNETNIGLQREAADAQRVAQSAARDAADALTRQLAAEQRAEQAEAAIARVRQMATYWEQHLPDTIRTPAVVSALRSATDPARRPDPGTVTITQARHNALTAGQCTHHQETHRLHHGEPVAGCPYPGCHPDA